MVENRELALVLRLVADQFTSEVKKSGGMLGEFNKFVSDWKVQLTAASGALFAIAKSTANYGDEIVKASQRIGTSIEDTARLQHAARLADTDLQGLSVSVGFLSKNMLDAAHGNAEAQATFQSLNIATTDANGRLKGTTQILLELNDRFRLMPEGPEKTALAMKAFGKSGREVLPLLSSDMRAAFTEAEKLGLVMSEKDALAAEHFNDELTKLQASIRGVTNDIGTALIPKFDAIAHGLTTIITDARGAASALGDLLKLNAQDLPQVGSVLPKEGGRRLLVMPTPPKSETDAFAPESSGFVKKTQDELGKTMVARFISEEQIKASLRKQEGEKGKALLEIYLANNRAIDIRNKLISEQPDAYRHLLDFQIQEEQNEEDRQQRLGKMIVEQTGLEVKIREDALAKERDGLIGNAQAWVDYYDQLGGNNADFYQRKTQLLQAQLAKELDLTKAQSADLLDAWQQHDSRRAEQILALSPKGLTDVQKKTAELNAVRQDKLNQPATSDDVFGGWAEGMRKYVKDTQSGFGLAADMARRTAQMMEQGFQNFFFDAMTGKISTLKDALRSLLNFAQQIVSQIAAQLVTRQAVGAFTGMDFFGEGAAQESLGRGIVQEGIGQNIVNSAIANGGTAKGFAVGGSFRVPGSGGTDSTPVGFWATPGETVDIRTPGQQSGGGGVSVVINNYGSAPVESAQSGGRGPDGRQMIYVTIRDAVKKAFGEGALDKTMASRYRMIPQAGG